MRNVILFILLFCWFSSVAQPSFYKEFEVDSVAMPRGGMAYLTTFVQTNLRKPIIAEALGVGGTTILSGIVEPDGHISGVTVIRNFRPDCDREATRVFGLFNAWKPAQKDGKAVRQLVNIPVVFRPNDPFIYAYGTRITYFDDDRKLTTDSSKAYYKQIVPLDSIGSPSGDIVVYKSRGKKWEEVSRLPLIQKDGRNASGRPVRTIGYSESLIEREGNLLVVDRSKRLVRRAYFQNGKRIGPELTYHLNGAVNEKIEDIEERIVRTRWFSNGQIRGIRAQAYPKPLSPAIPEQVMAIWDSAGRELIKDGTGYMVYDSDVTSNADSSQHTRFVEKGTYKNGFKQGLWKGNYADGSYFYEEQYDNGICQTGRSVSAGSADTLHYKVVQQQPEFPGGLQGLGQFLSQNLQYPSNAQKANAQGRVFVSFVVCTDGTLCDYEVVKGVHPELDEEAVRVVKKMSGKWQPGVQRGQKVRVKYNLPINFSLH